MSNSQEHWAVFPEDPRYSASNLGRIKNNVTNRIVEGWVKKTKYNTYKCFRVGNSRTGGKIWHFHYVILSSFVPKPESNYVCDHINRNTMDNRLENLRWVSYSANILNSDRRTLYCFYNGEYFHTFNGWEDAGHYFHRHHKYLQKLNREQGNYRGFHFISAKEYRQMTGYNRFIVSICD